MNSRIETSIQSRCEAVFTELDKTLQKERLARTSEAQKHGAFHSPRHMLHVMAAFEDDLSGRARVILEKLAEALRAFGGKDTADHEPEIIALAVDIVKQQAAHLWDMMNSAAPFKESGAFKNVSMKDEIAKQFWNTRDNAVKTVEAEIPILVADFARSLEVNMGNRPGTNVHVHGGQGNVFQIGDFNTVTQHLALDQGGKDEVLRALDVVAAALEANVDTQQDADELMEMVEASKAELSKNKPNARMLQSMLYGLAVTIQTSAAMKPAYDTLKAACQLIGISLP